MKLFEFEEAVKHCAGKASLKCNSKHGFLHFRAGIVVDYEMVKTFLTELNTFFCDNLIERIGCYAKCEGILFYYTDILHAIKGLEVTE